MIASVPSDHKARGSKNQSDKENSGLGYHNALGFWLCDTKINVDASMPPLSSHLLAFCSQRDPYPDGDVTSLF